MNKLGKKIIKLTGVSLLTAGIAYVAFSSVKIKEESANHLTLNELSELIGFENIATGDLVWFSETALRDKAGTVDSLGSYIVKFDNEDGFDFDAFHSVVEANFSGVDAIHITAWGSETRKRQGGIIYDNSRVLIYREELIENLGENVANAKLVYKFSAKNKLSSINVRFRHYVTEQDAYLFIKSYAYQKKNN